MIKYYVEWTPKGQATKSMVVGGYMAASAMVRRKSGFKSPVRIKVGQTYEGPLGTAEMGPMVDEH